jgi:hypothetical protein
MAYALDQLRLESLLSPVAEATAQLARLDERLARSPVADGWRARGHFHDAAAALWLAGELVHVEDLVFHDARMDVRAPSHALTLAHEVLRTRRRIAAAPRCFALSPPGLRELTGRARNAGAPLAASKERTAETAAIPIEDGDRDVADDGLSDAFAEIDAVLARSSTLLAGKETARKGWGARADDEAAAAQGDMYDEGSGPDAPATPRPAAATGGDPRDGAVAGDLLIYDADWDEPARLAAWQSVVAQAAGLPPVLRAAIALDAWTDIAVLQHGVWLGPLLVGALLRDARLALHHLPALHLGLQRVSRERRRARSQGDRLLAMLEAMREGAEHGMAEHDRLMLARTQMERKLQGRRSSSSLPAMIELVLARPLVSTGMVQAELKVSRQGALDLVAALGLREMTGRGRYKAWGVV